MILGLLADRWGRVNMLVVCCAISAIASVAFWLPSTLAASLPVSQGLFITYAVVYGAFAGSYVSLFPAAIVEAFGPANFASVNGILYMARGLGTLAGTPSAGAMISHSIDAARGNYLNMTIMVSALLVAATAGVVWGRFEGIKRPAL